MTESLHTVPEHVGIIMDGNGRWATRQGLSRKEGHKAGAHTAMDIIHCAIDCKVKALTLYAFSTENWERSEQEVSGIMNLLHSYLSTEIFVFLQRGVKFKVIGERDCLSSPIRFLINRAENLSAKNRGMCLNLALSYGSKNELIRAIKRMAKEKFDFLQIKEEHIDSHLDTKGLPPVDLLIRTSGEQRLSNFLLWQCAYAEFYFTETLWPDFTREAFREALESYGGRSRRFGGVEEGA